MGELNDTDFKRIKEKLEALLELSVHRHPAEAEIEGIDPKSTPIVNDTDSPVNFSTEDAT
jgi:hypothetical protein